MTTFSTPVDFHIADDEARLDLLTQKAKEVDDYNLGQHQVKYTTEQAFTTVWHDEPQWLVEHKVLEGWTVETPGLFTRDIQWEDAPEVGDG